jgi:hypothetical protein
MEVQPEDTASATSSKLEMVEVQRRPILLPLAPMGLPTGLASELVASTARIEK